MAYASPWRQYLPAVLLIYVILIIFPEPILAENPDSENSQRLMLNVYLDGTGKALVAGYTENPDRLLFLNSSQYSYENETGRLYVLTNALTRKDGDLWTLYFNSSGSYEDYRVIFYLPGDFMLKNISNSQGLAYTLSLSNESIAVDFQGVDIQDPAANIEYLQPMVTGAPESSNRSNLFLAILFLASVTAASLWWRKMVARPRGIESKSMGSVEGTDSESDIKKMPSDLPVEDIDSFGKMHETESSIEMDEANLSNEIDTSAETNETDEEAEETSEERERQQEDRGVEKIEISSEMAAVMETLTPRERAVLQALIERGGRSTQADLRYTTRTPRSSLSGIISSLERRKIIIKKESGRTNVIELSDWFLSRKR